MRLVAHEKADTLAGSATYDDLGASGPTECAALSAANVDLVGDQVIASGQLYISIAGHR